MSAWRGGAVLGVVLFGLVGCDEGDDEGLICEEVEHSAPWGYEGEHGPSEWGDVHEDFELCESGMEQSPIDLSVAEAAPGADLERLQTNWEQSREVDLWNNGHTWQVNLAPGSTLVVPGARGPYHLKQFHFHAPSEHTLDGELLPMEVHFVHVPEEPESDHVYAVIGVFFKVGEPNPTLERLWGRLSTCPQEEAVAEESLALDPTELLPKDGDYFKYEGSLTTPACLEGVRWHVLAEPITASQAQIDGFREVFGQNGRPVQKLHDREVLLFQD